MVENHLLHEDGADVSERFRLQTPAQRTPSSSFLSARIRAHRASRCAGHRRRCPRPASLIATPGFCRPRMKGQYWQVREKVFDYEGRFVGRTNYAVNGSFD